ncbi:ribosome-binding protein 1-like [Camellia sinensis]|uniref:ribosome-binding protein 1-like n=1 Tax=Camellia sinensis TaxID=4442 RepID=UPI001035C1D5|nr:ribosome-binding protein 1-like [Camellia sinensis]
MTVEEFFACYKASGQQETWVTLQAAAGKGLVAGLPSSIKGWRPRWFYVSASGGVRVRTIWKVPTKSVEPRLGAAIEERVKRVKEWREKEWARWDELVQPSALFEAGLGPQPCGGDLDRMELEARRKAQEAEDQTILAKAQKFKESQADRPPKLVTTLAGALLRKAGAAKLRADEAKAQLARLKKESANWESAHAELQTSKVELETTCRQVVSLEFQLAGEQKRLDEPQKACVVAVERHEEAMSSNEELKELEGQCAKALEESESLQKELEAERAKATAERETLKKELKAEKAKATVERASLKKECEEERAKAASKTVTLQKELDEERAKAVSERVAYPDLYMAAVDQFKGFAEFQMAMDAAVASSLVREESGGAGPLRTTAGGRTKAEVIESFQQLDFYKQEMAEFWDSGWRMFKRRAEELFPDLDLSSVTIGEDDMAQTSLDEGIEEEDLVSSEEE